MAGFAADAVSPHPGKAEAFHKTPGNEIPPAAGDRSRRPGRPGWNASPTPGVSAKTRAHRRTQHPHLSQAPGVGLGVVSEFSGAGGVSPVSASWTSRRTRKTHPPIAMAVKAHHWTA
ncbi:hypothetical protein ABH917_003620 [Thermobifida halotolerans]